MGNDGGSIPTRRELVKNKARAPNLTALKATTLESQTHAWTHCRVSDKLLLPHKDTTLASDARGNLYNYESLLFALAGGGGGEDGVDEEDAATTLREMGVGGLKDVVKLEMQVGEGGAGKDGVWVCPVSMKELGPATKSVYLVPCGHVFAEVAIKETSTEEEEDAPCPACSVSFSRDNVVTILPTKEEDIARLAERMEALREKGLTHSLKKDKSGEKKKKKRKAPVGGEENGEKNGEKKRKLQEGKGINNAFAASLADKVAKEQNEASRRRKILHGR